MKVDAALLSSTWTKVEYQGHLWKDEKSEPPAGLEGETPLQHFSMLTTRPPSSSQCYRAYSALEKTNLNPDKTPDW